MDSFRFETARAGTPVYCHQEMLEQLNSLRSDAVGKRASLVLQRLAVDPARVFFKATRGQNHGWRRSRLGGNHGSHFYLWWAPRMAAPLSGDKGFADAASGSVFVRAIRHHDNHDPLPAHTFATSYMPVTTQEMRNETYGPKPWTPAQDRFSAARTSVRCLKGYPGSGKTTALLNAADEATRERCLYVTYSQDLAALARQYFDCYCDREKSFHVVTLPAFFRELLGSTDARTPQADLRRRFRGDLLPHSRALGLWSERYNELFDEFYAHLVGSALPREIGRFAACSQPRAVERNYKQRRARYLFLEGSTSAIDAAVRLEKGSTSSIAARYFPDLDNAWSAAKAILESRVPKEYLEYDCIAIDECQDLTPIETFALAEIAAAATRRWKKVTLLAAGDEAQTVLPTDFEWGWFNDILNECLGRPQEFRLQANLRSPRSIATIVNSVWDLYAGIEKRDRPSGNAYAEMEDESTDQAFYCCASPSQDLNQLLATLSAREGVAMILMEDTIPAAIPEALRPALLTPFEAKGLDFHTACVINAGQHLQRIGNSAKDAVVLDSIQTRLRIDKLRVALSRPAERLIWLDIQPPTTAIHLTSYFLNLGRLSNALAPMVPGALLTALDEEQLGKEERIQRCIADARQYLEIRPEMAWSRITQAITLLGSPEFETIQTDYDFRRQTYLAQAEVCFRMAISGVRLPPELGVKSLFVEASKGAILGEAPGLSSAMHQLHLISECMVADRPKHITGLVQVLVEAPLDLAGWFWVAVQDKTAGWAKELEGLAALPEHAAEMLQLLPAFYHLARFPDADQRTAALRGKLLKTLVNGKRYGEALDLLSKLPERDKELEAHCYQGAGDLAKAGALYLETGKLKEALECYRGIPDVSSSRKVMDAMGGHPAAAAYDWMEALETHLKKKPENFMKVLNSQEKQIVADLASQLMGLAPAVASKGGGRTRVIEFLRQKPGHFYCAQCLVKETRAATLQQMYAITRQLAMEKTYRRGVYKCASCKNAKTCTGVV
ncbi:MAG: hypothetical protein HYZ37_11715 [Candidatus Solibacter usitatus]|nr:hypothetical protein [Candidatus Solibacter usitatus]